MTPTANPAPAETIDIRLLGACAERKARVLAAFDSLAPGACVEVVNDHMPNGLRAHFEQHRPGAYDWRVVEAGPVVFRVEIGRVA